MDPNRQNPSSSTPAAPEGMISFTQQEQLLRLLQPNANINQTLAAMAKSLQHGATPQIATAPQPEATPPTTEAVAEISTPAVSTTELNREEGVEVAVMAAEAKKDEKTTDVGGVDVEMEGVREENEQAGADVGRVEVTPDVMRTEMASVDTEGAEMVRTEMATVEVGMDVDVGRVEADMAEIEAEIRGSEKTDC